MCFPVKPIGHALVRMTQINANVKTSIGIIPMIKWRLKPYLFCMIGLDVANV
jgi:hypothetical protein